MNIISIIAYCSYYSFYSTERSYEQILSRKTSVLAIIYFMIFGTVFGKYGLHFIDPDVYGKTGLRAIISISVAIIVFEGELS